MNNATEQVSQPAQKKRLAFADGLRGLAALWVVLFHMAEGGHIVNIKAALPDYLFAAIFTHGDLGVAVFFVLSGFVMALTVRKIKVDVISAGKFLARRIIRLAPPYYFAIAFALIFIYIKAIALGGESMSINIGDIVAHLFFAQGYLSIPQINTVFWTLCVELQFYISFAALFLIADYVVKKLNFQHARYMLVVVMSLLALLWPADVISAALWPGSFVMFWYSFLAGVICCWACYDAGKIRLYAYGYIALLGVISLSTHSSFVLMVALTSLSLIYAGTKDKMSSWLSWPLIQFLGLISYSLYLLHNPLTGATSWVVHHFLPSGLLADNISLLVTMVVCVFVSWLAYLAIERPSIKWSHLVAVKSQQ